MEHQSVAASFIFLQYLSSLTYLYSVSSSIFEPLAQQGFEAADSEKAVVVRKLIEFQTSYSGNLYTI